MDQHDHGHAAPADEARDHGPDHGRHDHRACVREAMARAEAVCADAGAKLTPLRRRVLELLWSDHRPRGAYALLEDLAREAERKVAPLTVYRALDFLVEQGLVHRLESLNAYLGCAAPHAGHSGQFLVCEGCGTAAEIVDPEINRVVDATAAAHGFLARRRMVEISGLCRGCRDDRDGLQHPARSESNPTPIEAEHIVPIRRTRSE